MFRIVAHRGVTAAAPQNTIAAFAAAMDLGIDAIELDVRLTRDQQAVVFHNSYLDDVTTGHGPLFHHTTRDLETLRVVDRVRGFAHPVPLLEEVLSRFAGRLGLEIELKGPEPEAAAIVASLLSGVRSSWDHIEVTSFEPALLRSLQRSTTTSRPRCSFRCLNRGCVAMSSPTRLCTALGWRERESSTCTPISSARMSSRGSAPAVSTSTPTASTMSAALSSLQLLGSVGSAPTDPIARSRSAASVTGAVAAKAS